MAASFNGPIRMRFVGDTNLARRYIGIMRTQMGILKELQGFQDIPQLSRTINLANGASIFVQSVHGIESCIIDVSAVEEEGVAEAQAVAAAANKVVDYVGVAMPNPVPYRGIFLGTENTISGSPNIVRVVTSDGNLLASELQTITGPAGMQEIQYTYKSESYYNGGSSIWMFDELQYSPYSVTYNHKLTFTVPDDCVFPLITLLPYPGTDGLGATWDSEWLAANESLRTRRKQWLKFTSDEFLIAANSGFSSSSGTGITRPELQTNRLPGMLEFLAKKNAPASNHTFQPTPLTVSYSDVIVYDTTVPNSPINCTRIIERTAIFSFIDLDGNVHSETVTGRLQQDTNYTSYPYDYAGWAVSLKYTFTNWFGSFATYGLSCPSVRVQYILATQTNSNEREGVINGTATYGGLATYVSGVLISTAVYKWPNSSYTGFGSYSTSPYYAFPGFGFTTSDIEETAPAVVIEYHNSIKPTYGASSTSWNDSALYKVKQIELLFFGPVRPDGTELGIFPDPTDADGCTKFAYYGKAKYQFEWSTGALTWLAWISAGTTPIIGDLPTGVSYYNNAGTLQFAGLPDYPAGLNAYNCAIGYVWDTPSDLWPDVDQYLLSKIATLLAGNGDQVLYTIIKASGSAGAPT